MATDNSVQGGADTIRDLARQAGTPKTQVYQLDLGGATGNAEKLITAGQQTQANSMPVAFAIDQVAITDSEIYRLSVFTLVEARLQNVLFAQAFGINDDLDNLRADILLSIS